MKGEGLWSWGETMLDSWASKNFAATVKGIVSDGLLSVVVNL
jgi:hypothetical protein